MKQLFSLFKREPYRPHKFLKDKKPNQKLWNELLKEIKQS